MRSSNLNRLAFIKTALLGATALIIPATQFIVKWLIHYDPLKMGSIVIVHTPEKEWLYVAFVIRDDERHCYSNDELWSIYGYPAMQAVCREKGWHDSVADGEKQNFLKVIRGNGRT